MRIKIKLISNITSFNHIDIYETKDLLPEKVSDDKYLFKRKINNNRIPFFYNCGNKNVYNFKCNSCNNEISLCKFYDEHLELGYRIDNNKKNYNISLINSLGNLLNLEYRVSNSVYAGFYNINSYENKTSHGVVNVYYYKCPHCNSQYLLYFEDFSSEMCNCGPWNFREGIIKLLHVSFNEDLFRQKNNNFQILNQSKIYLLKKLKNIISYIKSNVLFKENINIEHVEHLKNIDLLYSKYLYINHNETEGPLCNVTLPIKYSHDGDLIQIECTQCKNTINIALPDITYLSSSFNVIETFRLKYITCNADNGIRNYQLFKNIIKILKLNYNNSNKTYTYKDFNNIIHSDIYPLDVAYIKCKHCNEQFLICYTVNDSGYTYMGGKRKLISVARVKMNEERFVSVIKQCKSVYPFISHFYYISHFKFNDNIIMQEQYKKMCN